jgi:4-amino-4-deoxy-L-arabinose transferase-like glycosyltransferase
MRRAAMALILLAALLFRLLYLGQVASLPFFDQPVGDSAVYLERAAAILEGRLLPEGSFFYGSVLYPYLLAFTLFLPGGSLYLVCLLQVLAGTLLAYVIGRLARRLYGRPAGLTAAALAALYGPFAFLEADILGVVWGLLSLSAGLLWTVRWAGIGASEGEPRRWRAAYLLLAGLAFGLAAAERPNLLLLIPVAAAWVGWPRRPGLSSSGGSPGPSTGALAALLIFVGGAVLALSPVAALNRAASGRWSLLTTSGGINLYIGNNPRATGTFDEPWSASEPRFTARHTDLEEASLLMASRLTGEDLSPEEASAFWAGRAVGWIRGHPGRFAELSLRKAALLLSAVEFPNHLNYEFVRGLCGMLWTMPIGFGAVAPLAVVGIGVGLLDPRRRPGTILLAAVATGVAVSVIPFFVADRYRAPLMPSLLAAAGAGAVVLGRALSTPAARTDRRLAAILVLALLVLGGAHYPLTEPDLSRDYWLLAQAHGARGELPKAAAAYEAALEVSGGEDGVLLNNLARVYDRMGRLEDAEATLRRAIRADPALAYPHKNLGLLLMSRGALVEARRELGAASRIDGGDPETLGALAGVLAAAGLRDEASAAYRKARDLDPGDPRLARLLEEYPFLGEVVPSPLRRSRP